ncbi:hypothetical protein [Halomicrococcus gelatinilyticus]|uniref:hypothetical protein n=1 Tax=Halomicrococcus gelatinilyticus TaxID=1702103 RepID=UPI002E0EBCA2
MDAIIGDHVEHVFDEPRMIDGTVINTVGAGFHHAAAVTLADDGMEGWHRSKVTAAVKPDQEMAAVVDRWRYRFSFPP